MTPETPQAGKRSTAKTGNRAGGAAGSADASEATSGTPVSSDSARASAEEAGGSSLPSTPGGAHDGHGLLNQVRQKAVAQIREQKERATDGLGGVAHAVRESTQQLRAQHYDTVAELVERAADQIERFSNHLRERDLDQIVSDAQQLARKNPSVFIGTSFAAGLVAARLIKASRPEPQGLRELDRGPESWSGAASRSEPSRSGAFESFGRPRDETRGRGEV